MIKKKIDIFEKIAITLFLFCMFFSVCCIVNFDNNPNYHKKVFPRNSAIYIRKDISLKLCVPLPPDVPKDTKPMCLETELRSAGSGSVIKNTPNGSLVLTANHVCNFNLDIPPIFIIEKMDIKTTLFDLQGREYDAEVASFDEREDLCVYKVKYLYAPAIQIALSEPEKGDRVYNLSFPSGLYDIGLVMMYEGFYSGTMTIGKNKYATYSIFAIGGSSGSMLLNVNGDLIGMIHSGLSKVNNITFSPQFFILRNFLDKAIKKDKYF